MIEENIFSIKNNEFKINKFAEFIQLFENHVDFSELASKIDENLSNPDYTLERNSTFSTENIVRTWLLQQLNVINDEQLVDNSFWQKVNFDLLTGLPNAYLFKNNLKQEIKKAYRNGLTLALLIIDLDKFKEIRAGFGAKDSDRVINEVASRILKNVRESDFIARIGIDVFAIIINDVNTLFIESIALRILVDISKPILLDDINIHITSSIGVALYSEQTCNSNRLLKEAEQAVHFAKTQGRNCYHFFNSTEQETVKNRIKLANDLRTALIEKQFFLVYQPIIDLKTQAINKAEALIRWNHPVFGLIAPIEFISIAEETGLIIDIGEWVFTEAVGQIKHWRSHYNPEFQISINKSPIQINRLQLENNHWIQSLDKLDLPGQCIVIEITEGVLLEVNNTVKDKFKFYQAAGVQISLDDFGTGYSSLSYLKKLNVDFIKIDQSFVSGMQENADDLVLCETIIMMAHKLGIKIIAEGVETEHQRDLLMAMNCDYAQGYLFSKPIPANEFENLFIIH